MRMYKFTAVFILIFCLNAHPLLADDNPEYLSTGEAIGIGGSSLAVAGFGAWIRQVGTEKREAAWSSPLPLETRLQRILGGEYHANKTNFLNSNLGSAATTAGGLVFLTVANLSWPRQDKTKDVLQDIFLYTSGAVATRGLTDLCKGTVARQRPMVCLRPEESALRKNIDPQYDRQSFFSGHTSSAFFSATFVNLRARSIMRERMTRDEYKSYRWTSPLLTFGWASLVGWTRIHAYQHFLSDVLAGALVGYLMGEIFYSFTDEDHSSSQRDASPGMLSIKITF